jgi:hypothetical protein
VEQGSILNRVVTLVVSAGVGAGIIWRGHTYTDFSGSAMPMLTPVMCSIAGVLCLLTGIALACRGPDAEVMD